MECEIAFWWQVYGRGPSGGCSGSTCGRCAAVPVCCDRETIRRATRFAALRNPDLNFYLKPDIGGFAVGGWEANTEPAAAACGACGKPD